MDIEIWSRSRHLTIIQISLVMLGHVFVRCGGNDDEDMKQLLCDIWPALVRWTLFSMKAYREGVILHVEAVVGCPSPLLDVILVFLSCPTPVTHALLKASPALGLSAMTTFLVIETDHEPEAGFLDNLRLLIYLYFDDFANDTDVRRAIGLFVCHGKRSKQPVPLLANHEGCPQSQSRRALLMPRHWSVIRYWLFNYSRISRECC
ncbi:hypothetical protein CPB85DRAFT_1300118 [Mucidula mucida]|nr:hypothetical protein CPB85DRAFT_1300118 [Mucidula mucida]